MMVAHHRDTFLCSLFFHKNSHLIFCTFFGRCLSLVCNSWQSFVEFPLFGEPLKQSSSKKRKVLRDDPEFLADVTPFDDNEIIPLPAKNYEGDSEYGFKYTYTQAFMEAKECLLALKDSVENLNQKNLFPYNPEVLLKRYVLNNEFICSTDGPSHKKDGLVHLKTDI